jgi:uncharacterized protein with HEPN domain
LTDERIASHLDAIYDAALGAPEIVGGLPKSDFLLDRRAKLAGVMTLIIIGEAASRIAKRSPEYVAAHPEVDWEKIRGLRNRGAHGYDALDFGIVWEAVTQELPVLLKQVTALLDEFGGPLPPQTGS